MSSLVLYKLTSPSGKSYIGQTNDIRERMRQHRRPTGCRVIFDAIRKYGWDNFTLETLAEKLSLDEANKLEQLYIERHNTLTPNGYNLTTGGSNYLRAEETKQLMSVASKGKPKSEKHKQSMSDTRKGRPALNKGKPISEQMRQKRSKARKGKPSTRVGYKHSEETKQKLAIVGFKKGRATHNRGKKRKVDGETGKYLYC
jgi:group I intron endonuclease